MSTTSLPSRKPASSDAKLAADLRAQKSCRKFSLEWVVLGKQLLSPLPATATVAVSAAAQRAGLHMQEGKADLYYGQDRAGQGSWLQSKFLHRKTSRTKGLEMQQEKMQHGST